MQPRGSFFRLEDFATKSPFPLKERVPAGILKSCGANSAILSVGPSLPIIKVPGGNRRSSRNKRKAERRPQFDHLEEVE